MTDHQICLMSEHDIKSIDWQTLNEENDDESDDNDEKGGVCYDFEVKKGKSKKRISKFSLDLK